MRIHGSSRLATFRIPVLLAALCLPPATRAAGDFYRFVGEDGVETFTNTPTRKGAVRMLRETKPREPAARQAKLTEQTGQTEPFRPEQEPLLPVNGTVTSKVGWRHDPIDGAIRHHNGVDIAVPTGTPVKAIAAGRVLESGPHGGYGNLVTISHGGGMVSMYGHNSRLQVSVGEQVAAGQTVALSGSTGRSTGPHLHFELWKGGANVTESYLTGGAPGIPEVADGIRSYLHKDGSLVFTNR